MRRRNKRTDEIQEELVHRQAAETEARKLSRILEAIPMSIVLTDMEGKIEYVNPALLALGGYSSDRDIIGNPIFSFTNPEGVERLRGEVIPALLTGENWRGEMGVRDEDGSFIPSEMVTSLITDREGNPEYLLASFIDMTGPRKAAAKLIESEHRYRRLVDSANSYIFTIFFEDGQPVRSVYSPALLTMTGYTLEEMEEDPDLWQKMVLKEDRKIIREQLDHLLTGDTLGVHDYRIKQKDGEIRWFSATLSPTYDDSGNLVSYDGLINDITDRKLGEELLQKHHNHLEETSKERTVELEERVRQADQLNRGMVNLMEDSRAVQQSLEKTSRALKEANAELESFAYSAAHDLKAPLRAIEGYIGAVLDDYGDRLEKEGREYAERITGVCRRMAGLIDDLLSYSRLNQSEIRVKPIELSLVVDQVLGDLARSVTEAEARVDVEGPIPMVLANRSILLQVVGNLILNAITFVAPGTAPRIKIETRIQNGMVRLLVEDNGIGIKEEDRERVYQVFERLHGIETYPGTGI